MSSPADAPPTDPAAIQAMVEALITALSNHKDTATFCMCTAVILFYDYFLTLQDEIEYIWKRPRTFASILYVFGRYFAIIFMITLLLAEFTDLFDDPTTCLRTTHWQGSSTIIQNATIELIVIMRVYALYRGNKYITGFLCCMVVTQICVLAYANTQTIAIQLPPNPIAPTGCVAGGKPALGNLPIAFPIMPSVFDLTAFSLMTWRVYGTSRVVNVGLVRVMFEDGTLYFLCLLISNLGFVVTYVHDDGELKVILAPFAQTIGVILINRMLINMRAYYGSETSLQPSGNTLPSPFTSTNPSTMIATQRSFKDGKMTDSYEMGGVAQQRSFGPDMDV